MKSILALLLTALLLPGIHAQEEKAPKPAGKAKAEAWSEDPLALPFPVVQSLESLAAWVDAFNSEAAHRLHVARSRKALDEMSRILTRMEKARLHAALQIHRLLPGKQ